MWGYEQKWNVTFYVRNVGPGFLGQGQRQQVRVARGGMAEIYVLLLVESAGICSEGVYRL